MKLTSIKISRLILVLTLAFVVVSCKKDKPVEKVEFEGDQVPIQISAIVEDEIKVNLTGLKSGARNQKPTSIASGDYVGLSRSSDFEVATFLKNPVIDSTSTDYSKSGSGSKAAAHSGLKAASNMGDNIKFRVYIRNRTTGTWQTKVFSSNSTSGADTIRLYNVYNYDWYAFSNNTSNTADVPNILSGNNLEIMSGNNDLLWAKGEILASTLTTNKRLNIIFKHMLARVEVNLDYRGLFVNTMSSYAFNYTLAGSTSFRRGKLDVKSGSFIPSSHENYSPVSTAVMLEPPYVDQQQYVYYTSENQNFTSLKLSYTNLNYTTYDAKTTVYSASDNKSVTLTGTGTGGIVTAVGGKTVLNYIFIEAPVYAGANGSVKWARANLYYAGSGNRNPFRFRAQSIQGFSGTSSITPSNTYTTNLKNTPSMDMFMKNHIMPDSYINRTDPTNVSLYPQGDPCLEVLPKGAWQKASHENFQEFISQLPNTSSTYFKSNLHVAGAYNVNNIGSPFYSSRFVTFERNGIMLAADKTVSNSTEGYYWTSRNAASGIGTIFKISGTTASNWALSFDTQTNQTAASVRCVRSSLFQ